MRLPPISTLPQLGEQDRGEVLAGLFEPCPVLVDLIHADVTTPASSYDELIERVRERLRKLLGQEGSEHTASAIIAAHPRLGAKKVESTASQAEQASLKAASEEEARLLAALNDEYERAFPGLRYVVFVAGRPRSVIMGDMKQRIAEGDIEQERRRAFDAMCDIAKDRVAKSNIS